LFGIIKPQLGEFYIFAAVNKSACLMRLYKYLLLFLFILSTLTRSQAQTDTSKRYKIAPKREFRGVWLATVENIDWPKPNSTSDQQKQQLVNILESHAETGINAVFFQVRPAADAFYAKSSEPWSKWLNGRQGVAPDPIYDPLEFAIVEAHKRGMELHAWINPYRATNDNKYSQLSPAHITNLKPEWFFTYGGQKLFNPGLPEVREYIIHIVLNVLDNYDVDGIHMDDYFYPYPIDGVSINDADAFNKYGAGYTDIRDWRRHNVDTLIQMLGDSIHKHKPHAKFGVSPFGIWANQYQNPEGSETHGGSSYYENYADVRKWIKNGWVDYVVPQLYWPRNSHAANYDTLLNWWSNNTYNRHLYIGLGVYRIGERSRASIAYKSPTELPNEMRDLRNNARVEGSVFFSSNSLTNNFGGFADSLSADFYKYPALPPPMLWLDSIPPNVPQNLVAKPFGKGVLLTWQAPLPAKDNEPVYGYVVYRFEGTEKIDINDPSHIYRIQYDNGLSYQDNEVQHGKTYLYVITAIDRLKNESDRSPTIAVTVP
jgi:uncharacterized lipoprotein YddW (UPF0748 family)